MDRGLLPFILGMIQASPADLAKVAANPEPSANRHGIGADTVRDYLRFWMGRG